ncbi:MAG: DedA family protein [Chitinophagaceae bacterium]|jgi:membrane-associated protein
MRSLILVLTGLFFLNGVFAQQQVKIIVINQYEAPVDGFIVDGTDYKTSKDGSVTITVPTTDSAEFRGEEYPAIKIAVSDLKEGATVTIKKKFTWKDLVNPMFYIHYGGLWLLLFIIFAETGLFVGFFFPGDSLLFVAGIYSSNLANEFLKLIGLGSITNEWIELLVLCTLISVAGILGNLVGYWTGRKVGPAMFKWKDSLLFKKKYLHDAHDFYEQHGGGAIIMARFLPIVRTFAPIVAGIVEMDRKKFVFYNIVGSIAWVVSMIFAGHFLQIWAKNQFGIELKDKLELIVIIIIAVTTAPVIWKFFFSKKKDRTPKAD